MTPSILTYYSDSPTFSLAFSPLFNSFPSSSSSQSTSSSSPFDSNDRDKDRESSMKLVIGSYNDNRGDTNNLTVIGLDGRFLDLDDDDGDGDDQDSDDDEDSGAGGNRSRSNSNSMNSSPPPPPFSSSHPSSSNNKSAFTPLARAPLPYPASCLSFSPAILSSSLQSSTQGTKGEVTREMLACSSECLRLWDLVGDDGNNEEMGGGGNGFVGSGRGGGGSRLVQRAVLANSKQDYSAPLTSFSWSTLEPTHIVTSSIDTTCTVWDISTSIPITQLIAHDREVYDVAWSPASREVFASVGADGSVRMFDLRSLEHSTILYEATTPPSTKTKNSSQNGLPPSPSPSSSSSLPSPLLRLAFSPTSPTYLAVFHADSTDVQILDTRNPGTPALEIRGGGRGCVNGMAWGGETLSSRGRGGGGEGGNGGGPGWLATCSDDSTINLYNLSPPLSSSSTSSSSQPPSTSSSRGQPAQPKIIDLPTYSYSAKGGREVNNIAWSHSGAGLGNGGDWIAAGMGRVVRVLKI